MLLQRLNNRDGQAASWLVLFLLLCLFGNCLRGLSVPLLTLLDPPTAVDASSAHEHHHDMGQQTAMAKPVDHAAMGHRMPMTDPDQGTSSPAVMACCDDSNSGCQLLQDKLLTAGISFDPAHFTPVLWLSALLVIQLLTQLRLLRYASDPFAAERSYLRGYPRRHLLLAVFRN